MKPILGIWHNPDFTTLEELKQEAIKWIKEIDGDHSEIVYFLGFVTADGLSQLFGARTVLMKFFNITEEDLK